MGHKPLCYKKLVWVVQQLRFDSVCLSHTFLVDLHSNFKIQLEAYKATDGESTAE